MTQPRPRLICGACLAERKIRPYMDQIGKREYRCPVCQTVMIRRDTDVVFTEGVILRRQREHEQAYDAKPRVHEGGPIERGGGAKSGRKRRKESGKPLRPYLIDRTFGET